MPLLKGKGNIGSNITEMMNAGHPYRVARAAALHTAYGKKPKAPRSKLKSIAIKKGFQKIGK